MLFRKFVNKIFVSIFVGAVHDNNFSFQNLLEKYLPELFDDDSKTDQSDVNKREKMIQFSLLKKGAIEKSHSARRVTGYKIAPR